MVRKLRAPPDARVTSRSVASSVVPTPPAPHPLSSPARARRAAPPAAPRPPLAPPAQSAAIEETLSRLAVMGGVESYVITDGKGAILRQSKGISAADAAKFAAEVLKLTQKARHVVRDLDPKNDLEIMRLRAKDREILAAPGDDFLVIIVQKWRAASDEK